MLVGWSIGWTGKEARLPVHSGLLLEAMQEDAGDEMVGTEDSGDMADEDSGWLLAIITGLLG
jgi:hypothetical protein